MHAQQAITIDGDFQVSSSVQMASTFEAGEMSCSTLSSSEGVILTNPAEWNHYIGATNYWSHRVASDGYLRLWRRVVGVFNYMSVNHHGYVLFAGGHGNASDASLKSDPENASTESCLQMLRQVSARTYHRRDLPNSGSRRRFVAQEVQSACPDAFGNLIGTAQHSDGTDEREILFLDYARLGAVLWQCTRSLLARGRSTGGSPCAVR